MRRFLLLFSLTVMCALALSGVALAGKSAMTPSTSRLSFGKVAVGTFSSLPVTFTNNTAGPVLLNSVTLPDTHWGYTYASPSCASFVQSGATCQMTIEFYPTATGHYGGKVVFNWSDGPDTSIGVGGAGVNP